MLLWEPIKKEARKSKVLKFDWKVKIFKSSFAFPPDRENIVGIKTKADRPADNREYPIKFILILMLSLMDWPLFVSV